MKCVPASKICGGQDFNSTDGNPIGTSVFKNTLTVILVIIWTFDWIFNQKVVIGFIGFIGLRCTCPSWVDQ